MDINGLQNAVDLRGLCLCLNDLTGTIRDIRRRAAETASITFEIALSTDADLLEAEMDRAIQGLPKFGGDAPADTSGIWSWDADSLLVGEGWEFEIIVRP